MKKLKFVYSPKYEVDLKGHIFPTVKYRLIKERVEKEGIAKEFIEPDYVGFDELSLILVEEYLYDLKNARLSWRTWRSELPVEKEVIDFFRLTVNGTYLASKESLSEKIVYHIGGGFHHAYPDHAEGFCYINDIAYAIIKLKKEGLIKKAAVIDCDLHQGNGTAYYFKDDEDVFTFSIHQENNYPVPKEKSDIDIGLDDGTGDEGYLTHLQKWVPYILDNHRPELVIYEAGADPYEDDQLGGLKLTKEGLKKRDYLVLSECFKRNIPTVIVLGGGYPYKLEDLIEIHFNTAKIAFDILNSE